MCEVAWKRDSMIVTNNVDDREMSFSRGVIELSVSSYTFLTLYPSDFAQEGVNSFWQVSRGGGKSKRGQQH